MVNFDEGLKRIGLALGIGLGGLIIISSIIGILGGLFNHSINTLLQGIVGIFIGGGAGLLIIGFFWVIRWIVKGFKGKDEKEDKQSTKTNNE